MKKLICALLLLCIASQAIAEDAKKYKEIDFQEPSTQEKKRARDYAKGRQQNGEAVLKKVITAEVSKLTHESQAEDLGSIRKGLVDNFLFSTPTGEARSIAVDTVLRGTTVIAQSDNYSPPARINAMVLLAGLDDAPGNGGSTPPQPCAKALNVLVQMGRDENQPLYLRSIALYGIERQIGRYFHTNAWNVNMKRVIGQTLMQIINSSPKTELDLVAHGWMVRRAMDCMAATGAYVPALADKVITMLGDENTLPSLRMSSAKYMMLMDNTKLTPEQKKAYFISLAHFMRSQLVDWYEMEDDLLNRSGGGSTAFGGGMGGGMGGGYGGEGGMGSGMGMGGPGGGYGGEGGMGSGMGMGGPGGGMGMGGSGYGSGSTKVKAKDVMDWKAMVARRRVNQIAEISHLCLDGFPVLEGKQPKRIGVALKDASLEADESAKLDELLEKLDELQEAVNDANRITNVNDLLQQAEARIEEIMTTTEAIPGFLDKYPDLAVETDLASVPDQKEPPAEGSDPNKPGDPGDGGEGGEGDSGDGN